ncbi:hypothetical protein SAMN06295905_0321 [Devosia lucknowensis]|uniref:Uncharacterized protein n=1 Tax=Devosia lucknowensis TaxID=1096929 RepID=A0A1Y6EC77_9HYPH|nr:hypothetical protein [Devosia lucknowensis]SMQ60049.1 hypothetical protein SAMN06295905_0321 [Devosia lucknowensis]
MSTPKTIFSPASGHGPFDRSQSERQLALEYLAEAWNSAEEDGLEPASLAHASLFAALATFVRMHGDEATADLVEQLPERIRNGEYNLERILQ